MNEKATYEPGPWGCIANSENYYREIGPLRGTVECEICCYEEDFRLIINAPETLEALKEMLSEYYCNSVGNELSKGAKMAIAVIEKVTGHE